MSQLEQVLLIGAWTVGVLVSVGWLLRDARERGVGLAPVLLCFVTFPVGPILWLLLRPARLSPGLGGAPDSLQRH